MEKYLKETYFFDYSHDAIQSLVTSFRPLSKLEQIEGLFLKIREEWRYNPYNIYTKKEEYRASFIGSNSEGHCIDKSTLFVAGLRALGIPARLRLAKVANHIAVERLTEKLGSNYIAPHGISEVYVNDKWVKCSNAFNKALCDKYNVDPLEFDGTHDAIFQAYNRDQHQFMEYLEDYGAFEDVPFEFILKTFIENYRSLYQQYLERGKIVI